MKRIASLPDSDRRCSRCGEELRVSAGKATRFLLAGLTAEASRKLRYQEFVEYPVSTFWASAGCHVRTEGSAYLREARTDYDLIFALCGERCAQALSAALAEDDEVVSIEQLTSRHPRLSDGRPLRIWRSDSISLPERGDYLILTAWGNYTRRRAMRNTIASHAMGRRLGLDRYLVDLRQARNTESVLSNYAYVRDEVLDTDAIDRNAVVALLVSREDHSHDFVEIVARNAGLPVILTREWKEAEKHLAKHTYA